MPSPLDHLDELGNRRGLPKRDLSLQFMREQFEREVGKPMRQLGQLAELWTQQVPEALASRTRLVGLSRGVLHVEADDSATVYELDRLLRGGLERELLLAFKGPSLRRVRVVLGHTAG